MVVKINGMPVSYGAQEEAICDEIVRNAPKLRRLAITWWITSGALLVSAKRTLAATDSTVDAATTSQDIMFSFQDLVMMFGGVAIVVGLILLVVKKKWGVKTLQLTTFITVAAFLAPAAILLLAIIGMSINDHLLSQLQHMRAQHH